MQSPVIPNQSFLVKQFQNRIAAALTALMFDLGCNVKQPRPDGWRTDPQDVLFYPTGWRKNSQKFWVRRPDKIINRSGGPVNGIEFQAARWDNEQSRLDYGPKTVDQKINEGDSEKSKIVRNGTSRDIHVAYSEGVDLTNAFSSSITKGVSLDMSVEVASEQKVSGEYAGVSAEVSVSEKFGIAKGSSKEEAKEQSKEGTDSEEIAIEFDALPRTFYLVEVNKEHERTSQPFDIDGVMDFDIILSLPQPSQSRHAHFRPNHDSIRLIGVAGLLQFVHGFDTNYPMMQGYWAKAPSYVKSAMAFIEEAENRRIQVSGIHHASLESNADYNVEELGGHAPSEFEHLPQVDAEDVEE